MPWTWAAVCLAVAALAAADAGPLRHTKSMAVSQIIPGDPWVICDICGSRFRMSQTRKTWDGLRVCPEDYDPKHPLLNIRGKADRQAVFDSRPEPPDRFVAIPYDIGSFCLISPGGIYYIVHAADDGAWLVTPGLLGNPLAFFHLGSYHFGVEDDGAIVPLVVVPGGLINWRMVTPASYLYLYNAAADGAVIPTYMGSFPA